MIYYRKPSNGRARIYIAGDSLIEAKAFVLALGTPAEAGSEYLDTPTGLEYIWDGTDFDLLNARKPVLLTDPNTTITGVYTAIKFLTDGVTFTTLTSNLTKNGNTPLLATDITGTMFGQGEILPGVFTMVKIATGNVLLIP